MDTVGSGCSRQWTQCSGHTCSGHSGIVVYMVVGTFSFVLKGQTNGYSGIVVYGDGDIVSDAKRSNQWMR